MIVTFCGHGDFVGEKEEKLKLMSILEQVIGESSAEFFLGGYGGFDAFAYACAKEYKKRHEKVSLIFVTPYMTEEYQKKHLEPIKDAFDAILYPDIEGKPLRFAISYRNKYMVEKADIVIAYITHGWGGAYKTYEHARRKGKRIINLGSLSI